jgi:hypothetical protein
MKPKYAWGRVEPPQTTETGLGEPNPDEPEPNRFKKLNIRSTRRKPWLALRSSPGRKISCQY